MLNNVGFRVDGRFEREFTISGVLYRVCIDKVACYCRNIFGLAVVEVEIVARFLGVDIGYFVIF